MPNTPLRAGERKGKSSHKRRLSTSLRLNSKRHKEDRFSQTQMGNAPSSPGTMQVLVTSDTIVVKTPQQSSSFPDAPPLVVEAEKEDERTQRRNRRSGFNETSSAAITQHSSGNGPMSSLSSSDDVSGNECTEASETSLGDEQPSTTDKSNDEQTVQHEADHATVSDACCSQAEEPVDSLAKKIITGLHQEVAGSRVILDTVRIKVNRMGYGEGDVPDSLDAMKAEIRPIRESIQSDTGEIFFLNDRQVLTSTPVVIDDLRDERNCLTQKLESLQSHQQESLKKYRMLQVDNELMVKRIQDLEQKWEENDLTVDHLSAENVDLASQLEAAHKRNAELESEVKALRQGNEDLLVANRRFKACADEYQKDLTNCTNTAIKLDEKLEVEENRTKCLEQTIQLMKRSHEREKEFEKDRREKLELQQHEYEITIKDQKQNFQSSDSLKQAEIDGLKQQVQDAIEDGILKANFIDALEQKFIQAEQQREEQRADRDFRVASLSAEIASFKQRNSELEIAVVARDAKAEADIRCMREQIASMEQNERRLQEDLAAARETELNAKERLFNLVEEATQATQHSNDMVQRARESAGEFQNRMSSPRTARQLTGLATPISIQKEQSLAVSSAPAVACESPSERAGRRRGLRPRKTQETTVDAELGSNENMSSSEDDLA